MTGIDSTTRPTPNQETEQLKAEIQALFLDYIRLRNVVNDCAFDVRFAHNFGTFEERKALEDKFEQERQKALATKRALLALTAPAEPAPEPTPEPKRIRTSIEAAGWHCAACGDTAITERENRPVCNECRAMFDSGCVTMDELLYGDDDALEGGE
jgi:hypothetical protein